MKTMLLLCSVLSLFTSGCGKSGVASPENGGNATSNAPAKKVPETMPVKPEEKPVAEPEDQPVVETDKNLAEFPSMPISQVLGKTRADIETLFYPSTPGHAPGWVKYNQHMELRYEDNVCVEMIVAVRDGLTCKEAAVWVGFGTAMWPIRKLDKCIWPARSVKHLLGKGYSGELILEGGLFTARLEK